MAGVEAHTQERRRRAGDPEQPPPATAAEQREALVLVVDTANKAFQDKRAASERRNGKAYGSMVVYLTKAADARKFLKEGFSSTPAASRATPGYSSAGIARSSAITANRWDTRHFSARMLRPMGDAQSRDTATIAAKQPC